MNRAILLALVLSAPLASPAAVCRIVSGGSLAFGPYDVLASSPADSQVDVAVTCDRDGGPRKVTLTLLVDQGANGSAVNARRMVHTGGLPDALAYGIYSDPARSSVWGNTVGINTIDTVMSVENKDSATAQFIVFGRIPAGQDVPAGSYRDTVQVTLMY